MLSIVALLRNISIDSKQLYPFQLFYYCIYPLSDRIDECYWILTNKNIALILTFEFDIKCHVSSFDISGLDTIQSKRSFIDLIFCKFIYLVFNHTEKNIYFWIQFRLCFVLKATKKVHLSVTVSRSGRFTDFIQSKKIQDFSIES